MALNVARDVTLRAQMVNDVDRGAKSAKDSVKKLVEGTNKIWLDGEKKRRQEQIKDLEPGGGHGGGGHFSRLFQDQSTTGLDPVSRVLAMAGGDALGVGVGFGALAVAGTQLADITEKAVAFRDKLHEGQMGAAQVAIELGESIPILGSIVRLGQNIRELYTGEKYQLQLEKETRKSLLEMSEREYSFALKNLEAVRDRGDALKRTQRDTGGVGLRGSESQLHAFASEEAGIKDAAEAARQKARDAKLLDPDVKAAQDAVKDFNEKHGQRFTDLANANPDMADRLRNGKFFNQGALTSAERELQSLYEQKNSLEDKAKRVEDKHADAAKKNIADVDAQEKSSLQNVAARRKEYEKLHQQERGLTAAQNAAEAAHAAGSTGAESLGTSGQVAASRRAAIAADAEYQRKQATNEAQSRLNATTSAEERAEIQAQLAEKLLQITKKSNADLAQANKEAGIERGRAVYYADQSEADAAAAANAQRLREVGKGYDAERVLRKRELDRQKEEIDHQADEQIKLNRDNEKEIRAKAASDKSKLDSEYKEKDRQAREGEIAGRFGVAKDLLNTRVDALQQESRFGNMAAAVEAKRLQITSEFADKRAQLNKLIRDPNVTASEKALAQSQLVGLDAQESREKMFANFTGGSAMPTLMMAGRVSGAALRANEENSPFIALSRFTKENGKFLQDIKTASETMAKVFQQNPQIAALFNFKPSR